MERKKIFRLVVLSLCCVCVLFNCFPKASAAGIYDSSETVYKTLVGGSCNFMLRSDTIRWDYNLSTDIGRDYGVMESGDTYVLSNSTNYYDYDVLLGDNSVSVGLITRAIYEGSYIDKNDTVFRRITLDFDTTESGAGIVSPNMRAATYDLTPFAFYWDPDLLYNLIRVRSFAASQIVLSGTLWYVDDRYYAQSYDFGFTMKKPDTGGQWVQAVFTRDYCDHFEQKCNLSDANIVLFTNLRLQVVVDQPNTESFTSIGRTGLDILAVPSTNSRWTRDPTSWFVEWSHQLTLGRPGGGDSGSSSVGFVTSFLSTAVNGFFDAEIMPGFSLGSVFAVIISIILILLLLKYFAGG